MPALSASRGLIAERAFRAACRVAPICRTRYRACPCQRQLALQRSATSARAARFSSEYAQPLQRCRFLTASGLSSTAEGEQFAASSTAEAHQHDGAARHRHSRSQCSAAVRARGTRVSVGQRGAGAPDATAVPTFPPGRATAAPSSATRPDRRGRGTPTSASWRGMSPPGPDGAAVVEDQQEPPCVRPGARWVHRLPPPSGGSASRTVAILLVEERRLMNRMSRRASPATAPAGCPG